MIGPDARIYLVCDAALNAASSSSAATIATGESNCESYKSLPITEAEKRATTTLYLRMCDIKASAKNREAASKVANIGQ